MVTDTRVLLAGLTDYQASLERHLAQLQDEFQALDGRWQAFSAVYQGNAADQFRAGWERTTARFQEYLTRTTAIRQLLARRIEALQEADRQSSDLA